MWRVEGAFITSYCKHSYIHCVHNPPNAGLPSFPGGAPHRGRFLHEKTLTLPEPETPFYFTAVIPPHVQTLKQALVRGRNLGNSNPFRCGRCNSREEITALRGTVALHLASRRKFIGVSCLSTTCKTAYPIMCTWFGVAREGPSKYVCSCL
jgi:hypothetical protein